MTVLRRLDTRAADFTSRLAALTRFEATLDEAVERTVAGILADVHLRGDAAVVDYTNRFDRQHVTELAQLRIPPEQLAGAHAGLPAAQKDALAAAAERIRAFHQHQLQASWSYVEEDGTRLGQQVTPLERVGLYVPGSKAM